MPEAVPDIPAVQVQRGFRKPGKKAVKLAVEQWHQKLSGRDMGLYIEHCKALCAKPITVGMGFAGCDVGFEVMKYLAEYVKLNLGVTLTFQVLWRCEKDPDRQRWLRKQYPDMTLLFDTMEELGGIRAYNVISGSYDLIPHVMLFIVGWTCVDKSAFNSQRAKLKMCLRDRSGKSGKALDWTLRCIAKSRPDVVILENVGTLLHKLDFPEGEPATDAEYIEQELAKISYDCVTQHVQASDYGSFADRFRLYWVCVNLMKGKKGISAEAMTLTASLHIPKYPLTTFFGDGLEDIIDGNLFWKHDKEPETKFFDDLMLAYEYYKLPYPPVMEIKGTRFMESLKPLSQRQRQILFLADTVDVLSTVPGQIEFVDINQSLEYISKNAPSFFTSGSIPTLATSTQIYARLRLAEGDVAYALLHGSLMMRLVGFDSSMYNGEEQMMEHELLKQMAGNAFSAFAFGPVLMGALGAWPS